MRQTRENRLRERPHHNLVLGVYLPESYTASKTPYDRVYGARQLGLVVVSSQSVVHPGSASVTGLYWKLGQM